MSCRRSELTDLEWPIIALLLLNWPRGAPRADDRKVLNGIFWRILTDWPWAKRTSSPSINSLQPESGRALMGR